LSGCVLKHSLFIHRELKEPTGWKHFVLEKASLANESDESDSDASSAESDVESDSSDQPPLAMSGDAHVRQAARPAKRDYVCIGVSKRHAPINVFLVQICVLSNHAAGKDTHIRGIHIFGPPTRESRERAEREVLRNSGRTLSALNYPSRQTAVKHEEERLQARQLLNEWLSSGEDDAGGDQARSSRTRNGERDEFDPTDYRIPTSRRLDLLSTLR
jgi:hypothetical protein